MPFQQLHLAPLRPPTATLEAVSADRWGVLPRRGACDPSLCISEQERALLFDVLTGARVRFPGLWRREQQPAHIIESIPETRISRASAVAGDDNMACGRREIDSTPGMAVATQRVGSGVPPKEG